MRRQWAGSEKFQAIIYLNPFDRCDREAD